LTRENAEKSLATGQRQPKAILKIKHLQLQKFRGLEIEISSPRNFIFQPSKFSLQALKNSTATRERIKNGEIS